MHAASSAASGAHTVRLRLALSALLVAVVLLVLTACTPGGDPTTSGTDETPVLAARESLESSGRKAFFAFGNAVGSAEPQLAEGELIEMRLPFELGVAPDAFRVRVDNVNFLEDERLSDFDVESIYLGITDGTGNFIDPVRLSGPQHSSDGAVVTGWFDVSELELPADEDLLLGVSFSLPPTSSLATAPGVGWIRVGLPNGSMALDENIGEFTMAGTFLDIDLEYTVAEPVAEAPITAVIGHSLNAGANQNPQTPHDGENSAWHQLWARQHHAMAASMAAAGSWTPHYVPESTKWERAEAVDADVLALWASSSDLVSGTDPSIVREYWQGVIDDAKQRWPGVRIVAFTEPPRGAQGQGEQFRIAWNTWLRSMPDQIDALVDADALLADPSNPNVLAPTLDGDGDHFSPAGHQVIADAFAQAVDSLDLR